MGERDVYRPREDNHDKILAEHILRTAELSYRMEIDRGNSLASLTSKLLTAISVVSIALVTLLPVIAKLISGAIIGIVYGVVFLLLVGAFVLCLISQYRFKYKTLVSPARVAEEMKQGDSKEPFESFSEAADHFCKTIEASYISLRRKNDIANSLMRVAIVLLLICCGVLGIGLLTMVSGFSAIAGLRPLSAALFCVAG